ncbi:acyl-CoA N-acyltransferase [Striga asiatica]|uniref:Acyl-CoA N-acyltransferase n=1 Tax=Striga asiatica TaxID=4170 RepID=A0A5A7Q824_STRAF|nr:acyl-CoA N-acyltransferase [Striga asiatica]
MGTTTPSLNVSLNFSLLHSPTHTHITHSGNRFFTGHCDHLPTTSHRRRHTRHQKLHPEIYTIGIHTRTTAKTHPIRRPSTSHQPTADASSAEQSFFTPAPPKPRRYSRFITRSMVDAVGMDTVWGCGIRLLSADAVDMDSEVLRRPPRSRRKTSSADPLFVKFGFDSVTNLATASGGERLHHITTWWPPRTLMSDAENFGGEDKRFGVVEGLIDFGAFHMKIRFEILHIANKSFEII